MMDFICKPNKKGKNVPKVIKVDYDIKDVQKEAVWDGVIQADSKWAWARENSFKSALKDALKKEEHYKTQAKILQKHILENFKAEKMHKKFIGFILDEDAEQASWLEEISSIIKEYE